MEFTLPNGRKFKSKLAAKRHFQAILYKYKRGQILSSEDQAECMALFECHPDAPDKLALTVKDIKVDRAESYGSTCFWLITAAGEIDISFHSCIEGAKSHFSDFCQATRRAIRHQIWEFRDLALSTNPLCPVSGILLTRENCHVDHVYPFTFSAWISHIYRREPESTVQEFLWLDGPEFSDKTFEAKIKEWHKQDAHLRLVHKNVNLRLGANP